MSTKQAVGIAGPVGLYESPEEMREVLDRLLFDTDQDPVAGPMMRRSGTPHRFVFTDADVVLNVTAAREPGRWLQWDFDDDAERLPALSLEMTCDVANRFLQGRENLAIAMARGRISVSCPEARSALSFLPASRELIRRYSEIIANDYPHLVVT